MPNLNNKHQNENEDQNQLSEVKKTLYVFENQAKAMHFSDEGLNELHEHFKTALQALSQATDRYYTKDDQGNYPVMSAQAFADFEKLYRRACQTASALENGLRQADTAQLTERDLVWKDVYDGMMDMVLSVLGQDLQHLHSVQRQGNETLPSLIEKARTRTYDVSGQNLKPVGGNLSSRLVVTIPGPDGASRGFFTESASVTEQEEIDQLKRGMIKKNPGMAKLIQNADINDYMHDFDAGTIEEAVLNEDGSLQELLRDMFPDPKSIPLMNTEFADFNVYLRQLIAIRDKYHMLKVGRLGENNKTDQKNCAMTVVADLLNMHGLVAHAETVELTYTENGELHRLKGSFMQNAEGEDILHQVPGKGLLQPDAPVNTEAAVLKQQLADLQVLDYICGNVDRHMGNIFYRLDESDPAQPKLIGIQGIDNDASFSLSDEALNMMVPPEKMIAVRKKTADLVEELTPELLKTVLRNFNLRPEQLDAVWARTQKLQNAIRSGNDYFRNHPEDTQDKQHLRVLSDEEFERFSMEMLKTNEDSRTVNYFRRIDNITNTAIGEYIDTKKETLMRESLDAHAAFFRQGNDMPQLLQKLKKADSIFRRRPEYQSVLDSAELLKQDDNSSVLLRKKNDIEEKMSQIAHGLEAINVYLRHKQENYEREMLAARQKGKNAENRCREKYEGLKSADAQRIRAAKQLQNKLREWQASGAKALQLKEEGRQFNELIGDRQYADKIREEIAGRRERIDAAGLRNKLQLDISAPTRKTAFRSQEKQDELGRSKTLGS